MIYTTGPPTSQIVNGAVEPFTQRVRLKKNKKYLILCMPFHEYFLCGCFCLPTDVGSFKLKVFNGYTFFVFVFSGDGTLRVGSHPAQ